MNDEDHLCELCDEPCDSSRDTTISAVGRYREKEATK